MKIGTEIRKARLEAGLSQEVLAEKAGVHRTYISMLERDVKNPSLDIVFRLCAALGISPAEFVGRVDRASSKK